MNSFEKKILDEIRLRRIVPEGKLDEIRAKLERIEGSLELTLLDGRYISEDEMLAIKAKIGGLTPLNLENLEGVSVELLSQIPEEAARQYKIVPLQKTGNKLKVGMVNPEDYSAQDAIRFIAIGSNIETELYVVTDATFQKILGQYRTFRTQIKEALTELEKELKEEKRPLPSRIPGVIKEAPVTKVVAVILKHAVEGKASDIHIESTALHTRVRFRVHGALYTSLLLPSRIHSALVSRIKILSNLRLDETRIPQDGRFSAEISGRMIDFRVSTFPTWLGEKVVLRVLDPYGAIQDLESLGLAGRNLTLIQEAIKRPFGMIMISGPTGSGKSSTLYAALSSMDRETVNAISLEDPVEYHIEGVSQSQIRNEIGYTFASGLRHVLRQDPDIIMVGEVRDSETAELSVHASLTGHLVFSTIHTNNAVGVVIRLQDMGVPFFLIPSAIVLTVAQRLVSRLCPYCKVKEKAPEQISAIVRREIEQMPTSIKSDFKVMSQGLYDIYHSPGCDKCARKGILGRIGIFETLSMTTELKKLVYDKANAIILQEEAVRQGMITLRQDGILKALQGIVSVEEVLRVLEEE